MFTTFFKMKNQPFSERVVLEQIFTDERMNQGLARLQYMALEGSIAVITGETGIGKSTLIKLFLSRLAQNQYWPVYIHFTHVRASSLFKLIVTGLGESPKNTKEQTFLQIMDKVGKASLMTLLIIDEAHLLDDDALCDLRLLISSALEDTPPLKMILSAQEGMKKKLKMRSQIDFAQRVSVYCHLKPLTKEQTIAYLDFQMKVVGASDKVFEPEVKTMIHEYANGIPRQINNIATACLINASIQKSQKVNLEILNQTMAEFELF